MYKCPKCGESESFSMKVELTIPDVWIEVDDDGYIVDVSEAVLEDKMKRKMSYEISSPITCNSCGYEAPADEFED